MKILVSEGVYGLLRESSAYEMLPDEFKWFSRVPNLQVISGADVYRNDKMHIYYFCLKHNCENNAMNVIKMDREGRFIPMAGYVLERENSTSFVQHFWVYDKHTNQHIDVTPMDGVPYLYFGFALPNTIDDIKKTKNYWDIPEFRLGYVYSEMIEPYEDKPSENNSVNEISFNRDISDVDVKIKNNLAHKYTVTATFGDVVSQFNFIYNSKLELIDISFGEVKDSMWGGEVDYFTNSNDYKNIYKKVSLIINHAKEALKRIGRSYRVQGFLFEGADSKRTKLYNAIINRLGGELGYKTFTYGGDLFILLKDENTWLSYLKELYTRLLDASKNGESQLEAFGKRYSVEPTLDYLSAMDDMYGFRVIDENNSVNEISFNRDISDIGLEVDTSRDDRYVVSANIGGESMVFDYHYDKVTELIDISFGISNDNNGDLDMDINTNDYKNIYKKFSLIIQQSIKALEYIGKSNRVQGYVFSGSDWRRDELYSKIVDRIGGELNYSVYKLGNIIFLIKDKNGWIEYLMELFKYLQEEYRSGEEYLEAFGKVYDVDNAIRQIIPYMDIITSQ